MMEVQKNMFRKLTDSTIKIDIISSEYDRDFVFRTFKVGHNGVSRPCDCQKDPDLGSNPKFEEELARFSVNGSKCLSPQDPPLMGLRTDICDGIYPVPHGNRSDQLVKEV